MNKIIGVVLLAGCLAACSAKGIQSGTVIGKHMDPAYQYVVQQCYSYNTSGICTMQIPEWETQPAEYYVEIQDGTNTNTLNVSESNYNRLKNGMHYP